MEEENVEIISCEAAEAIKRFREGDIDQIGDVTGKQLTGFFYKYRLAEYSRKFRICRNGTKDDEQTD